MSRRAPGGDPRRRQCLPVRLPGPTHGTAMQPTPVRLPVRRPVPAVYDAKLSGVRQRRHVTRRTYATSTSVRGAGDNLLRLAALLEPDAQRAA
jgi:hypothetical protein